MPPSTPPSPQTLIHVRYCTPPQLNYIKKKLSFFKVTHSLLTVLLCRRSLVVAPEGASSFGGALGRLPVLRRSRRGGKILECGFGRILPCLCRICGSEAGIKEKFITFVANVIQNEYFEKKLVVVFHISTPF